MEIRKYTFTVQLSDAQKDQLNEFSTAHHLRSTSDALDAIIQNGLNHSKDPIEVPTERSISVSISSELEADIKAFQYEKSFNTFSEAVCQLVQFGLLKDSNNKVSLTASQVRTRHDILLLSAFRNDVTSYEDQEYLLHLLTNRSLHEAIQILRHITAVTDDVRKGK